MWLAVVIKRYPNEMICDLAETYGIYDYTQHPVRLVATLVMGLRASSRVVAKAVASRTTEDEDENDFEAFSSIDEFEEHRRKIMEG